MQSNLNGLLKIDIILFFTAWKWLVPFSIHVQARLVPGVFHFSFHLHFCLVLTVIFTGLFQRNPYWNQFTNYLQCYQCHFGIITNLAVQNIGQAFILHGMNKKSGLYYFCIQRKMLWYPIYTSVMWFQQNDIKIHPELYRQNYLTTLHIQHIWENIQKNTKMKSNSF